MGKCVTAFMHLSTACPGGTTPGHPGTPRDFAKTTLKVHHSSSLSRAGVGTNTPTPRARKNVKILSVFSSNAFFICKYELYSIYIQLSYIPNVRTTQL